MSNYNRSNNGGWNNLGDRLNHVENQVVSIGTKVENIKEDVSGLVTSFDTYVKTSNESKVTDWATVASWAGIVIACISAMLYHNRLTLRPLELENTFQEKTITQLQIEVNQLKNDNNSTALQRGQSPH